MVDRKNRPALVILAAGLSERMGKPKHELFFAEGATFLEHIIQVYKKFMVSKIVLVINDRDDFKRYLDDAGLKIIVNKHPEYGRFHSIQLGLKEVLNTPVFIQNIDNPFTTPGLLMTLEKGIEDAGFAVPVYEERGGHPILLSQPIIHKIAFDFDKEAYLDKVLRHFVRKDIPVHDPYILVNINTQEDYRKYFSRI